MNSQLLIHVVAATALAAFASEPQNLDLAKLNLGAGVTLKKEGEQSILRIDRAKSKEAQSVFLFNLEKPAVASDSYALLGEIRYENMPSGSFLETWNHFPEKKGGTEIGASCFSRTMGDSGPMGKLSGNSDWRFFTLPFFMNDGSGRRPLRITFNAQFAGPGGVVEIRNLRFRDGLGTGAATSLLHLSPLLVGGVVGAAVATTAGVFVWRAAARRTQRELRRIQSMDA